MLWAGDASDEASEASVTVAVESEGRDRGRASAGMMSPGCLRLEGGGGGMTHRREGDDLCLGRALVKAGVGHGVVGCGCGGEGTLPLGRGRLDGGCCGCQGCACSKGHLLTRYSESERECVAERGRGRASSAVSR